MSFLAKIAIEFKNNTLNKPLDLISTLLQPEIGYSTRKLVATRTFVLNLFTDQTITSVAASANL